MARIEAGLRGIGEVQPLAEFFNTIDQDTSFAGRAFIDSLCQNLLLSYLTEKIFQMRLVSVDNRLRTLSRLPESIEVSNWPIWRRLLVKAMRGAVTRDRS